MRKGLFHNSEHLEQGCVTWSRMFYAFTRLDSHPSFLRADRLRDLVQTSTHSLHSGAWGDVWLDTDALACFRVSIASSSNRITRRIHRKTSSVVILSGVGGSFRSQEIDKLYLHGSEQVLDVRTEL